ncbi:MAG: hypothetical protein ACREQW_13440 [Candidatus Binatia bacterium]
MKTISKISFWTPMKIFLVCLAALTASCSSTDTSRQQTYGRQAQKPSGFFERLMDRITERECLVGGFSCPYGLGPADEPCECTEPSGRVLGGRTIK